MPGASYKIKIKGRITSVDFKGFYDKLNCCIASKCFDAPIETKLWWIDYVS